MTELLPADWIIAHRCVDLSTDFGAEVEALVAAAKGDENTLVSMESRFRAGFGVETDLRGDMRGADPGILISHDPPVFGASYPMLAEVLALYGRVGGKGCLALNIKDSGLQKRLKPLLANLGATPYFTFDGAVPDMLADCAAGITAFGRESEYEPFCEGEAEPLPAYGQIAGVWLDNFLPEMRIGAAGIAHHFAAGKDVAIVSPELHPWGRADRGAILTRFWTSYRADLRALRAEFPARRMMLCTKFPTLARDFFNP